jgi:hypothetical protein
MQAIDSPTRALLMQVSESLGDAGIAGKDILLAALVAAVGSKKAVAAAPPPDPWKLSKRRVDEANQKVRQLENQQKKNSEKLLYLQEQLAACQAEDSAIKHSLDTQLLEQTTAINEHNQLRTKEVEKPPLLGMVHADSVDSPVGMDVVDPQQQPNEEFASLQSALKRYIEVQATGMQPPRRPAGDGAKYQPYSSPNPAEAAAAMAKTKADADAFSFSLGNSVPSGSASSTTLGPGPSPSANPASIAPVPPNCP